MNLLIVEGNTPELTEAIRQSGGRRQSECFEQLLRQHPEVVTETVYPADCTTPLPDERQLAAWDGIVWTGSALNLYDQTPAVTRQVELARRAMLAGSFLYGSCWGLQIAAAACGGPVLPNPLGREFGVARNITPTETGRRHPLLNGRPEVFDALALHRDIVGALPEPTMTILATNDFSPIQAAELRLGPGIFWAVQYHPEYSFKDVASGYRRYGPGLVEESRFPNLAAVQTAAELYASADEPDAARAGAALRQLGIGDELRDERFRTIEIRNWIEAVRQRRRPGWFKAPDV
jgi:GMP synthase (glutamine-hydrolysing)